MNRRNFFEAAAFGAALSLTAARSIAAPTGAIRAVAFDGFVLFDPRPVAELAEEIHPGKGAALMNAWRTRQFEYTWLRTLTGSYADFWQVTGEALDFATAALGLELAAAQRERLLQAHLQLPAWPDVPATLEALRGAGVRLALLSNFTRAMLEANVKSAGIAQHFEALLSTDEVRAYKPAPAAYALGTRHFKLRRENILFAAFGGWDAVGAKRFGYPVFWCNRTNQPPEQLGVAADFVSVSTMELPAIVRGAA